MWIKGKRLDLRHVTHIIINSWKNAETLYKDSRRFFTFTLRLSANLAAKNKKSLTDYLILDTYIEWDSTNAMHWTGFDLNKDYDWATSAIKKNVLILIHNKVLAREKTLHKAAPLASLSFYSSRYFQYKAVHKVVNATKLDQEV